MQRVPASTASGTQEGKGSFPMSKISSLEWLTSVKPFFEMGFGGLYPCMDLNMCNVCPFTDECTRTPSGWERAMFIDRKFRHLRQTAKLEDLFQ
jgi:hypothetical protein